ncbi:MAG TPA: hypothetical protein VFM94_09385 [Solirubrobacterales bacterium]|nr:hypothetical protein [Solirubrobacterales bacterium]
MIGKLKVLNLILAAFVAMSAIAASTASAQQGVITSDGPVTLIGTAIEGPVKTRFTGFGETLECPGSKMTGHALGETPHKFISSGATTVTLTPHYVNCKLNALPVTIDMNGCDYEIKIGKTKAGGEYEGSGSVVCPVGKEVQMTVFSSSSHALKLCVISTSNGGGGGANVANTEETGDIDITGTVVGMHAKKSGLCGAATDGNASLEGEVTVEGLNQEGAPTAVSVTD